MLFTYLQPGARCAFHARCDLQASAVFHPLQCGVTALTWGHNGRRLFVATGALVHVAWIGRRIAPLQLLCRLSIKDALTSEEATAVLPLPRRVKLQLAGLFSPTLRVSST